MDEEAVVEAVSPAPAPSVVSAEEFSERRSRKDAIRTENTERGRGRDDRHDRKGSGERPRRYREDDEVNTTVGFGSETPAFMMVSAKV